jgi:hypothetical protein
LVTAQFSGTVAPGDTVAAPVAEAKGGLEEPAPLMVTFMVAWATGDEEESVTVHWAVTVADSPGPTLGATKVACCPWAFCSAIGNPVALGRICQL